MKLLGYVAALLAICIYAGMFAVGRHGAANGLNGFDQTAIRFAFSGVAVLPLTFLLGTRALLRLGWLKLGALVVLGGSIYSAVFLSGLVFAPAAYGAALVPGLQPIVVLVLSAILFGDKLTGRKLVGPTVCVLGLVVLMSSTETAFEPRLAVGVLLFVLSALMWGSYAVALKLWRAEPNEVLAIVAPLSALAFLPAYLVLRGASAVFEAPVGAALLQVVYQGAFVGLAAVFLYAFAVKACGSVAVSSLSPSMPVIAAVLAWWLVGERPTYQQFAGIAIVSIGLLLGALLPNTQPTQNAGQS